MGSSPTTGTTSGQSPLCPDAFLFLQKDSLRVVSGGKIWYTMGIEENGRWSAVADLQTDVRYIKGVGETRAAALARLGIHTLRDLITFFPRGYEDRTPRASHRRP